jgi:hypothetical protein
MVTAVCETDTDDYTYEYYEAVAVCTVTDDEGNQVAYNQNIDEGGYLGYAYVVLTFQGLPGIVYTAKGKSQAEPVIPYDAPEGSPSAYYEDQYNFTLLSEGVPQTYLDNYTWIGPGPPTEGNPKPINLGYTTASAAIAPLLSVKFSGTKSPNDALLFIYGNDCSETLGLTACYPSTYSQITANWRWNIEVSAQVNDDASKWTVAQNVLTSSDTGQTVDSSGAKHPFTDNPPTGPDGPKPLYVQQTAGTKQIFWIDGAGPTMFENNGQSVDSLTFLVNFNGIVCSKVIPSACSKTLWYVKIIVKPGGILDTVNSQASTGTGH